MMLYLATGAFMELDEERSIGFHGGPPTKTVFRNTIAEVERLFGLPVVTWGAALNPATGVFWMEVGDANHFSEGSPTTESLLPDDPPAVAPVPPPYRRPAWDHLRCPHPEADRRPGGGTPVRYGTFETETCGACGFYRTTSHIPGSWVPGPVPTEVVDDEDDA